MYAFNISVCLHCLAVPDQIYFSESPLEVYFSDLSNTSFLKCLSFIYVQVAENVAHDALW